MKRSVTRCLATALGVCTASSAHAHHSHPIFYDHCKTLTLEGRVESAQWKNPHVLIVVTMDDGTTYTAEWTSLDALTRTGVTGPAQAVLTPGARVVVLGASLRDPAQIRASFPEVNISNTRIVDVIQMRRVDDSWRWSRTSSAECK
jgi:hypothetical protein